MTGAVTVTNITGTASNVTGIVGFANGGTSASTRQAAINALAGGVTAGQFLRGDGTNVSMTAIQSSDVSAALGFTPSNVTTTAVINPSTPKNGDIQISGSVISIYNGGWKQIFPAVYS